MSPRSGRRAGPTLMVQRALSPALVAAAFLLAGPNPAGAVGDAPERHGIAMHGEPALRPGFAHLPYANPQAPKGGRIAIGILGTFDSLNPLVVIGVAPDAVPRYVQQSLLARALDEPFTGYGLLARSVEMPEDRSFVLFRLDPRARFSDGRPVTAADVRFTFGRQRITSTTHSTSRARPSCMVCSRSNATSRSVRPVSPRAQRCS